MALGWVLFACGLPMILFCTFIGGVSPWKFLFGYASLLVVYLCYCTFALWVSCMTKRTMVSMNIVTVALAVINGLFPFVYMILSEVRVLDFSHFRVCDLLGSVDVLAAVVCGGVVDGFANVSYQQDQPGGWVQPRHHSVGGIALSRCGGDLRGLTLRRLRFPWV